MSYCTGKNIEKSRGLAIKMLVIEKKPVGIVADRFGVHRSTIWRWYQKWLVQNNHRLSSNLNRPNRAPGKVFRWYEIKWDIPSASAAPKSPHALSDDLIQLVLDIRGRIHLSISYRTPAEMLQRF